ncbi:MAG: cytochrome P450 [Pseudomonadota bacterium]
MSQTATSGTPDVDLGRPEVIADPYPYYDRLRAASPVFGYKDWPPGTVPGQDKAFPSWVILKHAEVQQVARDAATFSSRDPMQEASDAPTLMLVNHDPPRHSELRGIAAKALSPPWIMTHRGYVQDTVAKMIDGLEGDEIDVMDSLAPDLPAKVMAHVLGMPETAYVQFRRWATAFMLSADLTPEERNASNIESFTYFVEKVSERFAAHEAGEPLPDDLISSFIKAQDEGRTLTSEEVIRFCFTLVVAGAETTTYLLGNLVWLMAEHPSIVEEMRKDRSLIGPFMNEAMRFAGPPQRLFRIATRDAQVGHANIREGDWVALFFAAANRDPEVWPEPDKFILGRPNHAKHFTLGHGIHFCLGAPLARLEGECLIEALLDRFDRIEPGEGGGRRQTASLLNYGFDTYPVRLIGRR